jgi:hypothetical protein
MGHVKSMDGSVDMHETIRESVIDVALPVNAISSMGRSSQYLKA